MAFCLLVSLLPMQPSAVALPNSQSVGASGEASRVVPIFNSANSEQATMTGYLYSSKIVFAVVPVSGSSNFYVGLPKSLASTTGGRVKVAEVFASQGTPAMINNYSFAFNRFAVFVLEKDLIAANPAQLLTEEMDTEKDIPKIATAYSYGEYGNRTSTGSVKPCEGGPCSKDVRSLQLRILALKGKPPVSVMPNFPDQFKGQIILENSVDPKAGIACYGDGGAPVLTGYRNQELYMGAIADQFYVKACGAFPQATYDKDGKLTNFGYDTDLAISFISPVYKHTDLINRAKDYAKTLAMPSPTPSTKSATPSPTASSQRPGSVILSSSENNNTGRLTVYYIGKQEVTFTGFRLYSSIQGGKQLIKQVTRADSNCKEIPNTLNYSCELPKPTSENNSFKFKYGKSVLSAAAFNINGEGIHSSPYSIQLCSKYIFIGMRGSGEKYQADPLGIGKTLTNLFNEVKTHPTINGEISVDGVPQYPAVPVPFILLGDSSLKDFTNPKVLPNFVNETVNQTTMHLSKRFGDIRKACPGAKFLLAGFSQGAYGVNDFINILERHYSKDELRAVIAGVFLIANPAEEGRGIIPTLDAYAKSKELEQSSIELCATNAVLKRFVESDASRRFAAFNIIKDIFEETASGRDLEKAQQSFKDWTQWQKDFDTNSKNKSIKDLPLCQLLWTSILLSAVERKLTSPKLVKWGSHFGDGDIVADFCKLVFNPNVTLESAICFVGGDRAQANLIRSIGPEKVLKKLSILATSTQVAQGALVHTSYPDSTKWAKKIVTEVFLTD